VVLEPHAEFAIEADHRLVRERHADLGASSMHGKTVTLIAGAIAGGKPLIDSLKGLGKGLFK
jgi:hypothetical protein